MQPDGAVQPAAAARTLARRAARVGAEPLASFPCAHPPGTPGSLRQQGADQVGGCDGGSGSRRAKGPRRRLPRLPARLRSLPPAKPGARESWCPRSLPPAKPPAREAWCPRSLVPAKPGACETSHVRSLLPAKPGALVPAAAPSAADYRTTASRAVRSAAHPEAPGSSELVISNLKNHCSIAKQRFPG